ncbi:MAG TPA: hypothetical protein VGX78_12310 [Pirellulales bacterium]|nr:hypothetical protein [Pirellulales bacterium]
MSTLSCDPPLGADVEVPAPLDDAIGTQVWGILAGMQSDGKFPERRQAQRYPYPRLVMISPVHADGVTPAGPVIVAAGKHLSERGLGFFHPQPLTHRLVVASLETADGHWLGFLLDIRRCRFTRQGWYESGGRFVRAVASPLERGTRNAD